MTPHPDHQRRVEELIREACKSGVGSEHYLAERLARAELEVISEGTVLAMAVARLGGLVEGQPTQRVNFLQRIDELREIERLHAQPIDEGLRERVEKFLTRFLMNTLTEPKHNADALLRDLRTAPATPTSCIICDDPSHDATNHWPTEPTLTDRERLDRIELALVQVRNYMVRQCEVETGCDGFTIHGALGAIARELASRKDPV